MAENKYHCSISRKRIWETGSATAEKLYQSFGFVETGDMDGEEKIAVLKL